MADPIIPSTYQQVIISLRDTVLANPTVRTFRVGPLSSVELPDRDEVYAIKYPYVHLLAQPAQIGQGSVLFDFDLIVMDLADPSDLDKQSRTQSQMLEITRSIIAKYTKTNWDTWRFNMRLPITSTPFVERFLNDVAGWTSQITIEAVSPLSNCDNPVA